MSMPCRGNTKSLLRNCTPTTETHAEDLWCTPHKLQPGSHCDQSPALKLLSQQWAHLAIIAAMNASSKLVCCWHLGKKPWNSDKIQHPH